jgi:hypothetical protein
MSNRHFRRREAAFCRREVSAGNGLYVYLAAPGDPALVAARGLGRVAATWCDRLEVNPRYCLRCDASLLHGRDVGALLLAHPIAAPGTVAAQGFCRRCWELPLEALEPCSAAALQELCPGGRFGPVCP